MAGTGWTLITLALVAIPVVLLVVFLRRPYDSRSVPRDGLAMKGKATTTRTWGVWPNKAFEDTLRDKAADQSESGEPVDPS